MTTDDDRIARTRIRGRLFLLLPLAGLLLAGWLLITRTPPELARGTSGAWLSGNQRYAVFYDETYLKDPDRTEIVVTTIDMDTGEVGSFDIPSGHVLSAARDKDWNIFLFVHPLDQTGAELERDATLLVFLDFASHQTRVNSLIQRIEPKQYSRLVGERYWVNIGDDQMFVLDTFDPQKSVQSFAVNYSAGFITELRESNRFLVVRGDLPEPVVGKKPAPAPIELYEIDTGGMPKRIASWPAGVVDRWSPLDTDEKHVYSLSPDLTQIEVRSVRDGALQSSFAVPGVAEFDVGDSLYAQTMVIKQGPKGSAFFDLETRQFYPHPGPDFNLYSITPDRRYVFFSQFEDEYRCKVLDRETGKFVCKFSMPRSSEAVVLDDQLVVISKRYGFSVRVLDFPSGKMLREIKPLVWVLYLLFTLMVLYGCWCIAWMIVSAREGGWAWVDVMLVIGLPALLMILRTVLRGEVVDLGRPPTRCALACVIAAEMLAAVWIVFGKTRPSLRFLPLMVLIALLMILLTAVFHKTPWIVWHATKCGLVPALCLLPALLVMRLLGWRLRHEELQLDKGQVGQALGRAGFPLRDLILITVVSALLFAAARPVLDTFREFIYVNTELFLPLGVAITCGLAAVLLALQRRRSLFCLGIVLAVTGIVYVTWEPVSLFVAGRYSVRNLDDQLIHTPIAAGSALFMALIPYRLRHWRLSRKGDAAL